MVEDGAKEFRDPASNYGTIALFRGPYAPAERRRERDANQFAASLLMPGDLVRRAVNFVGAPDTLARILEVSLQAMEIRLKDLGVRPT